MATVVPVLASVFGDVWDWVARVVERITNISPHWLALALALKTTESALIGLGWRNILRASN